MDIHLTADQATASEKAAVDAELGGRADLVPGAALRQQDLSHPDGQAGQGAGRGPGGPPHRRDLLLPVLHAIQARRGWISPGALNYACQRLDLPPAEVHGVASFYGMFSLTPRPLVVAHVCDDIACMTRGADALCAEFEREFGPAGSGGDSDKPALGAGCSPRGCPTWLRSPCLGLCERGPAVLVTAAGEAPRDCVFAPASAGAVASLLRDGRLPAEPDVLDTRLSVPQAGRTELRLMRRLSGQASPYTALRRAIELGPEGVVREVIASRLLGRGGAAFPAGRKWETRARYIVCNADESEPGTFKDRVLMEGDPLAILEGMTIGAFATGAQRGYIYIRGEYPLATRRLAGTIASARADGLLGDDILGSGFHFDVELRRGAGAYICGEETALFNSIEGYRGEPRNKPPYPTESGLFHQPTVVNNVETLINIPEIILMGGEAYARIGTEKSTGYKLYCLSGHVARPGVYEVPFGPTLRELIALAGGVGGSGRLQAVLLGGAAGAFVTPAELDTPLTFEGTRAIGATLGSGVVMLFDDTVDLKRILLRIAAFFRDETCGQCVPCRIGAVRQEETLHRLVHNRPLGSIAAELATLREMGQAMRDASICGLGQTASSALESALSRWRLFHE